MERISNDQLIYAFLIVFHTARESLTLIQISMNFSQKGKFNNKKIISQCGSIFNFFEKTKLFLKIGL